LNFVQHVMMILKPGGRAAVVKPPRVVNAGARPMAVLQRRPIENLRMAGRDARAQTPDK
jgi:hypothetical protein